MLKLLMGGLSGIWGWLAAAGAAALAVLAVLARAKQSGRDEVVTVQAKKEIENAQKAAQIDRAVSTRKPDDVQSRLRDKHSRD